MKQLKISPLNNLVAKTLNIPGSKSFTNRALLLSALVKNEVKIVNPLFCDDTEAMIECLENLGICIEKEKESIIVKGNIYQIKDGVYELNARLSGTTIRFICALAGLVPGIKVLKGEEGLNRRPIADLVDGLRQLGPEIEYLEKEGFPPLKVNGSILNLVKDDTTKKIKLNGGISSQFLSAILMIAPIIGEVEIEIIGELVSKPYVDMTLEIVRNFGGRILNKNYNSYKIYNDYINPPRQYLVEGDYSSAGYFFAIAALTKSALTLRNLNKDSKQADRKFLQILEGMGNEILYGHNEITVKGNGVKPIEVNMEDCPDQIQTLAVLAAFANGITKISGIKSLRVKETDRVQALENELLKMGIKTEISENEMKIFGGEPKAAEIDTYGDHRMAMAFAVAGVKISGIKINNPDVVNKTFPEFWEKIREIGIEIESRGPSSQAPQDDIRMNIKKIKRIFLIGFRTTGKSAFGRIIAKKLGFKLLETDKMIVSHVGKSIIEFTQNGGDWKKFRQEEQKLLKKIINEENVVISTGGGLPVNNILDDQGKTYGEVNAQLIKNSKNSLVILLTASDKIIEARIRRSEKRAKKLRPLLDENEARKIGSESPEDLIDKVVADSLKALTQRKEQYNELADLIVDTGKLSVTQVVGKILGFIKGRNE